MFWANDRKVIETGNAMNFKMHMPSFIPFYSFIHYLIKVFIQFLPITAQSYNTLEPSCSFPKTRALNLSDFRSL